MLERITINLETVEALLYFWQATKDKEKVNEQYLNDVASMQGFSLAYDEEFTSESVRRVLSAITNKEVFASQNRKEGRFWNNNLWMLEDLGYTDQMAQPLKKLNLEPLTIKINQFQSRSNFQELEVFFVPLHLDDYFIVDNKLVINFFKVTPSMNFDKELYIGDSKIGDFIEEKLKEILNK